MVTPKGVQLAWRRREVLGPRVLLTLLRAKGHKEKMDRQFAERLEKEFGPKLESAVPAVPASSFTQVPVPEAAPVGVPPEVPVVSASTPS